MPDRKPWTVDSDGNVDTRSFWHRVKWGQLLSFGAGSIVLFGGLQGYGSDRLIRAATMLMVVGIAFRVIDVWKHKK